VSSIEWSSDGRYIVVCFKTEAQIAVWDVINCKKIIHIQANEIKFSHIHGAKFMCMNNNMILVSGDKAIILEFNQ